MHPQVLTPSLGVLLLPFDTTCKRQLTPGVGPAIARTTASNTLIINAAVLYYGEFQHLIIHSRKLILGVNMLATQSIPDSLDSATSLGLVFAGILFLVGLLIGIWKFQQFMARSMCYFEKNSKRALNMQLKTQFF